MKTISVREVAEALNISTRGVLYRREKGHLKGILVKNDRGVDEYRIYPTNEIIEGLRRINSPLVASTQAIEDLDVVDAQTVVPEEDKVLDSTYGEDDIVEPSESAPKTAWTESARASGNAAADQLWNGVISRFMEKLEEKDQAIGELRANLAEKERQLLLLPDHEVIKKKAEEEANKVAEIERTKADLERKRAEGERLRAEEERKNAEAKALESIALRKQIAALQEKAAPALERQLELEKVGKESELALLQSQLAAAQTARAKEVKALEDRLAVIEEHKKVSEESQRKLNELQQVLEKRNALEFEKASEAAVIREEQAKVLEVENAQLKRKAEEAILSETKLAELEKVVQELQKPKPTFWQKIFGNGEQKSI